MDPVPPLSVDLGPWWYAQTPPPQFPVPNPTTEDYPVTSPRLLAEHSLMNARANAERADLASGLRVYRIHQFYLPRLPKDQTGYFIPAGVLPSNAPTGTPTPRKLYVTATNPITPTDAIIRDWVMLE